jgi:hypothetical protein
MRLASIPFLFTVFLTLGCQKQSQPPQDAQGAMPAPGPAPGTPEWKIQNALSAGPPAVTANAAVMDWPEAPGAAMKELRAGTNGWTCMPDIPSSPGTDPMCLDAAFMQWAGAWQSHTLPGLKAVGFAYMLQGGSDASNTDPFATHPDSGASWVNSGPHIMVVFPDPATIKGMSTDHTSGAPYVMFQNTPYAHVMMPVK